MKFIRKLATQPTLPAVRAIPPRAPSLRERRTVRIAAGVIVAVAALGGLVGGALHVVRAVESGALPQNTFALAGLAVLAATAAYLAGRSENDRSADAKGDRNRARGRLVPAAKAKKEAARAQAESADAAASDDSGAHAQVVALRSKFLDDISQELRAPITSICLAARIIRKHFDSTPEVVAHFGDTLLAEADRLGQTVDEFVELARLESGITEWRESEVDAADLIQRAVAEIESIAVSYGVSVGFTLEPELPPLHADLDRVTQALTILLATAVRAASEGSEIVIQIAGAHGGWVFTVGGSSFVFPHAEARKIPVRSEDAQAQDERPTEPVGRGLGLCLCREIVGHYRGRLWVEGTPGPQGCVRFTLPYRQHRRVGASAPVATAPQKATLAAPRPEPRHLTPESAAADLELRRELAVKALRERAAGQSQSEPRASVAASETAKATATEAAANTDRTEAPVKTQSAATPSAAESASARSTMTEAPRQNTKIVEPEPALAAATTPAASEAAAPSLSNAAAPTSAAPAAETGPEPTRGFQAEARFDDDAASTGSDDADLDEDDEDALEVIADVELEPSPVHEPVSGTMITAHHRTAGPPVLAHAGVPAVRGSQSAASAAIQGSDDLLLEIAQAQTADGRQLVVSDQVRSLLENAPGTLPAVAGQSLPQAAAARGAYTPSRRRMVAAPWVVRTASDEAGNAEPPPPPQDPEVAAAQRARLNERLAKRLGIQRGTDGAGASPGASPRSPLSRSRRLG